MRPGRPTRPTRAESARVQSSYQSNLATPDPPAGTTYRWVRVRAGNLDDASNISKMQRRGWEPVSQKDHPDFISPSYGAAFAGAIGNGDLVLMKNSDKYAQDRKAQIRERTDRVTNAVHNDLLAASRPIAPTIVEHRSKVTTGRRPKFDGDDA